MITPNAQPALSNRRLVWLTDQTNPQRDALGLTSHLLDCDRLSYRYVVEVDATVQPWDAWKYDSGLSHLAIATLEAAPGAQPSLWFVTDRRIFGVLDRTYGMEARTA